MAQKVKIKIPKAEEKEVARIPSGDLGGIKRRFEKIDQILYGIMVAVVLALVAIVISIIGLFLDQMRYNNAAYRDYSDRVKALNSINDSNNQLLEQNKRNQDSIIRKQDQILEIINKR